MCKGNVFGYIRYLVHPHMYYLFSFFFFENTKYFNIHKERRKCFKETNNSVYPKGSNS